MFVCGFRCTFNFSIIRYHQLNDLKRQEILNTKEIDTLNEEYDEHYTIKCIGKMFYKVQDVFTTVKYVIIMMVPRIIELLIIVNTWSFALGRRKRLVIFAGEDMLSLI